MSKGDANTPIAKKNLHIGFGSNSVNVKKIFSQGKSMMYHSYAFRCNSFNKMKLNKLLVIGLNFL